MTDSALPKAISGTPDPVRWLIEQCGQASEVFDLWFGQFLVASCSDASLRSDALNERGFVLPDGEPEGSWLMPESKEYPTGGMSVSFWVREQEVLALAMICDAVTSLEHLLGYRIPLEKFDEGIAMLQKVTGSLRDPESFRKWLLSQPAGKKVGMACPFDGQMCPLAHFLKDSTGMSWIVSMFKYWPERGGKAVFYVPEWAERFVRGTDFPGYHAVSREEALATLDRVLVLCAPSPRNGRGGGTA